MNVGFADESSTGLALGDLLNDIINRPEPDDPIFADALEEAHIQEMAPLILGGDQSEKKANEQSCAKPRKKILKPSLIPKTFETPESSKQKKVEPKKNFAISAKMMKDSKKNLHLSEPNKSEENQCKNLRQEIDEIGGKIEKLVTQTMEMSEKFEIAQEAQEEMLEQNRQLYLLGGAHFQKKIEILEQQVKEANKIKIETEARMLETIAELKKLVEKLENTKSSYCIIL